MLLMFRVNCQLDPSDEMIHYLAVHIIPPSRLFVFFLIVLFLSRKSVVIEMTVSSLTSNSFINTLYSPGAAVLVLYFLSSFLLCRTQNQFFVCLLSEIKDQPEIQRTSFPLQSPPSHLSIGPGVVQDLQTTDCRDVISNKLGTQKYFGG